MTRELVNELFELQDTRQVAMSVINSRGVADKCPECRDKFLEMLIQLEDEINQITEPELCPN